MLRNGALTHEPRTLEQSDMARVAGITAYLTSVNRLSDLAPLFAGTAENPFSAPEPKSQSAQPPNQWLERQLVNKRLGIEANFGTPRRRYCNYRVTTPWSVPVGNATRVATGFNLRKGSAENVDDGLIIASFDGATVTIEDTASHRTARFDITESVELMTAIARPAEALRSYPVLLRPAAGDLHAELWIIRAAGSCGADRTTAITNIDFVIALGDMRDTRSP
jgi:hypothetical protein